MDVARLAGDPEVPTAISLMFWFRASEILKSTFPRFAEADQSSDTGSKKPLVDFLAPVIDASLKCPARRVTSVFLLESHLPFNAGKRR